MSPLFQHPALWFVAVPARRDRGGMAQTSLGQTLAQTLLDLEDGLGWDQVKSSFSYKQRAWVNAVKRLVATPDLELSVLQELTLQLYTAVKPAALYTTP